MGTLFPQDSYIANWLVERNWISPEERQQQFQEVTQSSSKFSFLESLFNQQILLLKQFEGALQEYLQVLEATCATCEKKYWGRFQKETPPSCKQCTQPLKVGTPSTDPIPGNVMGGCLVVRKLGQGGMGTVYLALHKRLNKWVALKILPKFLTQANQEGQRFLIEARSASQIENNNVVGVLDVGEEHGCYYMIQQFIDGPTLREWFLKKDRIKVEEILPILKGVCRGLYHAHKQQIVHRDIKPDNILLTIEGKPKIADFGLAKLQNSARSVSIPGTIMGTPHYMSPEQAEGKNVDHRTDIYSLGIMLFEFLTGQVPFDSDSPMSILLKHVNESVPDPCLLNPELDPLFAKIILKFLAKDAEARFQDCYQVLEALQAYEKQDLLALQQMGISLVPSRPLPKKMMIGASLFLFLVLALVAKMWFLPSQKTENSEEISSHLPLETPSQKAQNKEDEVLKIESPKHFFLQTTTLSSLKDLEDTFAFWIRENNGKKTEEIRLALTQHLQQLILNSDLKTWLEEEKQSLLEKKSEFQESIEQSRKWLQLQNNLERKEFTLPKDLPKWEEIIDTLQFRLLLAKEDMESACQFFQRIEREEKELLEEDLQRFREQLKEYIAYAKKNQLSNINFFRTFVQKSNLFNEEDQRQLRRILGKRKRSPRNPPLSTESEPIKNIDFSLLVESLSAFEQFILSCCKLEGNVRFCVFTYSQKEEYQTHLDHFLADFEEQIESTPFHKEDFEKIDQFLHRIYNFEVPDFNLIQQSIFLLENALRKQNMKPWKKLLQYRQFLKEAEQFADYFFQMIKEKPELLEQFKLKIRYKKEKPLWNSQISWQKANSEEVSSLFFHLPLTFYYSLSLNSKMNPSQIYPFCCFLFLQNEVQKAKELSQFVLNSEEESVVLEAFPLFRDILDTVLEENSATQIGEK